MAITIDGDGTITGVSVGGLPDGIVDTDMLAAGAVTAAKRGAGAILQVVHAAKTDVYSQSATSGSFFDVFSAQITPSATSSKVLIMYTVNASNSATNQRMAFRILRDSTAVGIGDASGSRTRSGASGIAPGTTSSQLVASQTFLDSPSTTSQITYKLQISGETGANTMFVNRTGNSNDNNTYYVGASHIVLMEIAG